MAAINWWAFAGVVLLAYVIPGPDFAVILRAATRSARAGIAAAVGAQLGLCVHMLLAVVGLSVVLPQFVVAGAAPVWAQIAALGVLDVALGALPWAAVVLLGLRLAHVLRRRRARRWWDRGTGTVLAGLDGGLVLRNG